MRMLVTGGCGFIGSHYVLSQFQANEDVELLNVDLLTYAADPAHVASVADQPSYRFEKADVADPNAMDAMFKSFQPQRVVHFAAESHVDRSIEDGSAFVHTNALGTQTLLEAARRHDVEEFLQVSTDEVYGSIEDGSFAEDDPLHPSSPYSASKAAGDLLAFAHHHTYGIPVIVTRCTNNYGPHQHPEKLIPKTIQRALADGPIPIYGTGKNVRDWLYVRDHCDAIDAALSTKAWGQAFNIAGRDERENLDLVRTILEKLGKPESLIEMVEDRPGHDWRYSVDDSKIRDAGWKPSTTFDEGLDATIEWLRRRVRSQQA